MNFTHGVNYVKKQKRSRLINRRQLALVESSTTSFLSLHLHQFLPRVLDG
jgi:hypothetical protein